VRYQDPRAKTNPRKMGRDFTITVLAIWVCANMKESRICSRERRGDVCLLAEEGLKHEERKKKGIVVVVIVSIAGSEKATGVSRLHSFVFDTSWIQGLGNVLDITSALDGRAKRWTGSTTQDPGLQTSA